MNYIPKKNSFLALLAGISANLKESYRRYNFTNISVNFPEILNFRKIYGPTR